MLVQTDSNSPGRDLFPRPSDTPLPGGGARPRYFIETTELARVTLAARGPAPLSSSHPHGLATGKEVRRSGQEVSKSLKWLRSCPLGERQTL